MYRIKRANIQHILCINELLINSNLSSITPDHLNGKDLAIAVFDEDKLIGFLWVGLMAKNTLGWIDYFVIHPDYRTQGVGELLAKRALELGKQKGVKRAIAAIGHHEFHSASAMNALKMAMIAEPIPYTFIKGNIDHMIKEINHG